LKYVVQYDINGAQAISIYSSRKEWNIKKNFNKNEILAEMDWVNVILKSNPGISL
jgi:hypothetical protein